MQDKTKWAIPPMVKVVVSTVLAVIAYFISKTIIAATSLNITVGYLFFSLSYLLMIWPLLLTRKVADIKRRANDDEGGRLLSLFLVCLAAFACLGSAVFLMYGHTNIPHPKIVIPVLSVASIMLSWALVHTVFTLHYAHEYYEEQKEHRSYKPLQFPGHEEPDYLDFAYFSFGIGATFQVADVEIADRRMRRLTLVHSLLSFLLNTFVVALTINIVASILK